MLTVKNLKTDKLVVKSNDLVEARYRLSLQESHVILWLLTQIKPEDDDFKVHKLKVKDFAELVGLKVDSQYKELQKITESLMQRVMKIREPGEKTLLQVSWLSSAFYEEDKGMVSLKFDSKLKPYLLQLKKQFTKINVTDSLKFKSIYAVRIYELLLQYAPIGKRDITVEELRDYCGIKENEYNLYSGLKRDVVNKAKSEINKKTCYTVDYTESKRSRKVDKIHWTIDKKAKPEAAKTTITEPKSIQREITMLPINYDSCTITDIVYFCKANVNELARDKIDYLLRINSFTKTDDKLSLGFESPFFRDRCDIDEVKNKLMSFFTVTNLEFL